MTVVMERRREYLPIEKVLKENEIKFHRLMTKICVFLDSGTVPYDNMDQAEDSVQVNEFLIPRRPDRRKCYGPTTPDNIITEVT